MPVIQIRKWYERLGNNLVQLRNSLHIAIEKKYNVRIPNHPFLNKTFINLVDIKDNNIIIDKDDYFFVSRLPETSYKCWEKKEIFKKNFDKVKNIIKSLFKIKLINDDINRKNILHIHIRSGDLFSKKFPHDQYICPPLSFYKNIIESKNWEKIILICEDYGNPCMRSLLKMYRKKIIYKKQSLDDDVKLILEAENIVFGMGSFVPTLLWLNSNVKKIYFPSNAHKHYIEKDNLEYEEVNIDNYIKKIDKWKNIKSQYTIMITN
jgi:hypothetical protein